MISINLFWHFQKRETLSVWFEARLLLASVNRRSPAPPPHSAMTVSVTAEADGEGANSGSAGPEETPTVDPTLQQQPPAVNITVPQQRQPPAAAAAAQQQPPSPAAVVAPPPTPPPLTDEELLAAFPTAKLSKLDELISNPRYERTVHSVRLGFN